MVREGMLGILGREFHPICLSSIFGQDTQPGYTIIFQAGSSGQNMEKALTSIARKVSTLLSIWLGDHLGDKRSKGHQL